MLSYFVGIDGLLCTVAAWSPVCFSKGFQACKLKVDLITLSQSLSFRTLLESQLPVAKVRSTSTQLSGIRSAASKRNSIVCVNYMFTLKCAKVSKKKLASCNIQRWSWIPGIWTQVLHPGTMRSLYKAEWLPLKSNEISVSNLAFGVGYQPATMPGLAKRTAMSRFGTWDFSELRSAATKSSLFQLQGTTRDKRKHWVNTLKDISKTIWQTLTNQNKPV